MRVVQAIGSYFPETMGGSEVYVRGLSAELEKLGVSSTVLAGSAADHLPECDETVRRYPVRTAQDRARIRGARPHHGFDRFKALLATCDADVYHQHGWSHACGLHHLEYARESGLPTVLTVHLPGHICLRGTMMHRGETVCDGRIESVRCGECWLHGKGLSTPVAALASRVPRAIAHPFAARFTSRLDTLVATPILVLEHRRRFQAAVDAADRVVSVCDWLDAALRRNTRHTDKLVLCRQGVAGGFGTSEPGPKGVAVAPLRIGFVGRADPVKGLSLLIEALSRLPDLQAQLIVHAASSGAAERAHLAQLREQSGGDARIRFREPVAHQALGQVLSALDVLAVPSLWLETGPLVVLEAQACGVPVIGSDLGGIAELVRHGKDGLLVPPGKVSAWCETLDRIATQPDLLSRLKAGIGPVRRMSAVAQEMSRLYTSLLDRRRRTA